MRISFHGAFRTGLDGMSRAQSRMVELQQKIISARKFTRPSEDPLGAERSLLLNRTLSSLGQIKRSAESAQSFIQAAESDLLEINTLIKQAQSIAIAQRDATATAETRKTAAIEVAGIRDEIMNVLNHKLNGRYIFGGHATETIPFVDVGGIVQYQGDGGEISIRVGPNALQITNVPGSELLSFGPPTLASSTPLEPKVSGGTLLGALNDGRGASSGTFEIEDEFGNVLSIDTTGMTTVQDVIDAINAGPPVVDVTATVNAAGTGIDLVAGDPAGTIDVRETSGGTTAADLNILGSSVGTLAGGDLAPALQPTTLLSDIPEMSVPPLGDIIVVEGGVSTVVSFSAPPPLTTVSDFIARFNQTVPGLTMAVSSSGTGLTVTGSAEFTIRDAGADATATRVGLAGTGASPGLFKTLEAFEAALEGDDGGGIADAIADLGTVLDGLVGIEGLLGSRSQRVESAITMLDRRELETTAELQSTVDLDMAAAIARFSEAQMIYQTALATATSLSDLNLLQFM